MLFLTKHWRWIVPATLVVLCIIVGTFVVVRNDVPQEPKTVYVMPERTGNASINTGRTAKPDGNKHDLMNLPRLIRIISV